MRILFTNDDGYDSQGLHAVADLFKSEHDIAVVAPDVQKSGFSHSLTLGACLTCREVLGYGYKVYALNGTPVDCVKFARNCVFPAPDLVISGINYGQNLGSDIMYSGTVAAATDAVHSGIRAIALSLDINNDSLLDFTGFARFFKNNFQKLTTVELPSKCMLNINYPACRPIGVKFVRMNTQETFSDGYKRTPDGGYLPSGQRDYSSLDVQTDEGYCRNGYITITPISTDRTDYATLDKIRDTELIL